jgi:hypothetical protein
MRIPSRLGPQKLPVTRAKLPSIRLSKIHFRPLVTALEDRFLLATFTGLALPNYALEGITADPDGNLGRESGTVHRSSDVVCDY